MVQTSTLSFLALEGLLDDALLSVVDAQKEGVVDDPYLLEERGVQVDLLDECLVGLLGQLKLPYLLIKVEIL